MKQKAYCATFFALTHMMASLALANSRGSVDLDNGRLKIQFSVQKEDSQGAYQLRTILEQHGFKNEGGFVRTADALAPLEIYNYLYDDGLYAFTIYLPIDDEKIFVSYDEQGFVSFSGVAAQELFDVVKLYVPRNNVNNLEQYKWADHAYCDKTKAGPVAYRCWIAK